MPQPNAHYLVIQKSLESRAKDLWGKHSNFAGFGSFGPDLFYIRGARTGVTEYETLSNLIHWDHSFDMYCSMLDYIKSSVTDPNAKDKLRAFAYGFYAHVVADSCFHPFITRKQMDHPFKHPTESAIQHKTLESEIDTYLLSKINKLPDGQNPYAFKLSDKIICHKDNSNRSLDNDAFNLFKFCLTDTYAAEELHGFGFQELIGRYKDLTGNHPIMEAYRDFITYYRMLFNVQNWIGGKAMEKMADLLYGFKVYVGLKGVIPVKRLNETQRKNLEERWLEGYNLLLPEYSVLQLFGLATSAMSKIIDESEKFFKSDAKSAKEFFAANSGTPFLNENYNLDTGLPSSHNLSLFRFGGSLGSIFKFGVDILAQNYRKIENS